MKNAVIAAVVAALVSSGASYAAVRINGHSIKRHSIPLNRLIGKLPRGPQGPAGASGASGKFSASDISVQVGVPVAVDPGQAEQADVSCPSGQTAISGGGIGGDVTESIPLNSPPDGWQITAENNDSTVEPVQAYAICAS